MTYELTGTYPAPDFFQLDPLSGEVTIVRDLRLDSLLLNSYTVSRLWKLF